MSLTLEQEKNKVIKWLVTVIVALYLYSLYLLLDYDIELIRAELTGLRNVCNNNITNGARVRSRSS